MKKVEVTKIIMVLKTSYPYAFKDMSKEEIESMVSLYEEMFKDDSYEVVSNAIVDLIKTYDYLPSIATIKNKIYDLTHDSVDNTDLWNKLINAISRSSYYAEEEFEKLPDLVKAYVRSPQRLREMAIMDSDVINSVEKGIFMKQIENIKEQVRNGEIVGRKDNLLMNKGVYQLEELTDETL